MKKYFIQYYIEGYEYNRYDYIYDDKTLHFKQNNNMSDIRAYVLCAAVIGSEEISQVVTFHSYKHNFFIITPYNMLVRYRLQFPTGGATPPPSEYNNA